MSQISKVLRDSENNGLSFFCPGCCIFHSIYHGEGSGARWSWDGNVDSPTFSPSILVRSREFTALGEQQYKDWMEAGFPKQEGLLFDSRSTVCHSFVVSGRIQFLSDCTHNLKGQIVDLPSVNQ